MFMLPAQCKKCGAIFDLRYDLEDYDGDLQIFSKDVMERESLCWHCRKNELTEESEENESDEIGEFLLEFE